LEEKEITIEIKNIEIWILIIFLAATLFLELQVTLTKPIAFGDEAFHVFMGKWISANREYPVRNEFYSTKTSSPGFYRPPLWNLLQGGLYLILGFNELIIKTFLPLISFLTGLAIYLLVNKLYSRNVALMSAIIVISVSSYVTYSVLFYVDILLVFYTTLAVLLTILSIKTEKKKYWALAGVFSAFSILTKISGYGTLFFLFLCFLFEFAKKRNTSLIKQYSILMGIAILLVSSFWIRSYYYYGTPDCSLPLSFLFKNRCDVSQSSYESKYSFVGDVPAAGTGARLFQLGIMNYFQFAYGFIWFVPLAFICGLSLIFLRKDYYDVPLLLLLIASIPIFYISIGGRTEDLARYGLFIVSVIGLVSAIYFDTIAEFLKKYHKVLTFVIIILVVGISFYSLKQRLDTMQYVKQFSPLFFEACNFVKENVPKNALLLSLYTHPTVYNCDRPAIWEISGLPDVVLSQDLNLTLSVLKMNGITHIFVQKFAMYSEKYGQYYWVGFVQLLESNTDHFKKIYENGPDLNTCLSAGGCDGAIIYEIIY
jgi:4-amino-4-deoxy-L-arabinose transferase-like glycosyltransferase